MMNPRHHKSYGNRLGIVAARPQVADCQVFSSTARPKPLTNSLHPLAFATSKFTDQ